MTTQTKPIEAYSLPTPNGQKVHVILEELGVPYNYHRIDIGKGEQFTPEFLAISPNNKIPAIVDPEGPGGEPISIFESGAILKYLGTKFGQFYPTDPRQQVKVDEWLFWQMGGFGPMLGQNNHFSVYAPEKVPYAIKRYSDETHRLFRVLDKQLEGRDFITGEYSIADMACIGWAQSWERYGIDKAELKNFAAWIERLNARPAVAKGLNVGKEAPLDLASDKDAQKVLFNQR
ncbi:glutathione S-transferase N-terminal domain-containing protein [Devosia neptuniae]|jgi:GSH-dependent disulfide-bond oxidoreductase|uniref:glutathione S-transferase family protein n=1 Tax=Devosia TaxID=46913 RepID=UPI0022AF552A|nr:glutathione S-transferase N-terminal domain-containing protein [Devosia neptuniae]MCZ4346108.1 glutathione S-transferase N-terminal domain-containing protein [Devosia neptuniae]|tara:strand:+ start:2754 stop:3449 length:696 start_codon:yes stop_codon:yes gene_type:complete